MVETLPPPSNTTWAQGSRSNHSATRAPLLAAPNAESFPWPHGAAQSQSGTSRRVRDRSEAGLALSLGYLIWYTATRDRGPPHQLNPGSVGGREMFAMWFARFSSVVNCSMISTRRGGRVVECTALEIRRRLSLRLLSHVVTSELVCDFRASALA